MPALSWMPASEGPMVWSDTSGLNLTGRAPYFSELASEFAEASVKDPVIWALPLLIELWKPLDSMVWPSSTMENWPPTYGPVALGSIAWEIFAKVSVALDLKLSSTIQLPSDCWSSAAEAEESWVPSIGATLSSSLLPWSSHEISGRSGTSTAGTNCAGLSVFSCFSSSVLLSGFVTLIVFAIGGTRACFDAGSQRETAHRVCQAEPGFVLQAM